MDGTRNQFALRSKRFTIEGRKTALLKVFALILVVIGCSLAWRYTAISQWVNFDTIIAWQTSIKNHPAALLIVIGAYVAAGLVFFPVTILSVATVFTFGPILGNLYSLAGWLCSAALGYSMGYAVGHEFFHKLAGPRMEKYLRSGKHGFITVFILRLLPVAPFTLANMFIGASTIRFRDFMWGSTVGRIPGMIMMALAGVQLEMMLSNPQLGNVVLLVVVLILLPIAFAWLCKKMVAAHDAKTERAKMSVRNHLPLGSPERHPSDAFSADRR